MSEVKVNKISPRTNCGTVQLGDSGDTITIPAGATITNSGTATGFGATGAVNWQTTVKTSGFTATAGEGYFVNTTSGAISVNLPAGTAGAIVGFSDYAKNFNTNALTLVQNGSDKINGSTVNATIDTQGLSITLVFVDSTKGWIVTDDGVASSARTATYITGSVSGSCNTLTNSPCGDYKIATFKGPGTFTVCSVGNACGSNTIEYVVVAGGGAGGRDQAGGGGGGGLRHNFPSPVSGGLPVTATGYPVTVGGGGPRPGSNGEPGGRGSNSVFAGSSSITSTGGGGGSGNGNPGGPEVPGGAGGGGDSNASGGTGNTPAAPTPLGGPQGKDGGTSSGPNGAGGGGGGGACGSTGGNSPGGSDAGNGGDGSPFPAVFVGSSGEASPTGARFLAGGGGGSAHNGGVHGTGGQGGGGRGGGTTPPGVQTPEAGAANQGGGGGGDGNNASTDGNGGSGIVIIRYKFQN